MCYSRIWYEFRDPDITVLDIFTNFSSLNNKVVVSWNRDSCWCVFVNFIDAQTFECRTSRYAMNDIGSKSWINMIVFLIALGRHSHLQSTNRPFQSVWSHTCNAQRIRAKQARNKKKKRNNIRCCLHVCRWYLKFDQKDWRIIKEQKWCE